MPWHWPDGDQHQGGDGGSVRHQERFCPYAQVRVAKKGEKSQAAKYRKRLVLIPWIEMLLGAWFMAAILYTSQTTITSPRRFDFVCGGLLVYRADEPAARPLRALAHRRGSEETSPKPFPVECSREEEASNGGSFYSLPLCLYLSRGFRSEWLPKNHQRRLLSNRGQG